MKIPWMPFYVSDYMGDNLVSALSLAAQGCYMRILCKLWANKEPYFPCDPSMIARIIGVSPEEFAPCWNELTADGRSVLTITEDGRFTQKRLLSEWTKAFEKSEKAKFAQRKSVQVKQSKLANAPANASANATANAVADAPANATTNAGANALAEWVKTHPQSSDIRYIDTKDTEETSSLLRDDRKSIAQPDDEFPIYLSREEIPLMFSETVDLLLSKTGRTAIAPDELDALRELDRLHTPSRVQQEITRSVARFKSRSRPLSELTFCYLLDALRHQTTRKQGPPPDDIPYDAVAKAWNEILGPHGKPEVTELHDKRKYAIARIWREAKGFNDLETWEKFFRYVSKTKFMAFEGCGFDWLTDYENFVKAREGTYTQ